MDYTGDLNEVVTQWHLHFLRGTDFDLWGQPVEAIDCYSRLAAHLRVESSPTSPAFTDEQKKVLNKVATCLELRSKALQTPSKLEGISLDDLKKVDTCLRDVLVQTQSSFPLEVSGVPVSPAPVPLARLGGVSTDLVPSMSDGCSISEASSIASRQSEGVIDDGECLDERMRGTLLPLPEPTPGHTLLTVHIDKIGLKDALSYLDAFITVSVKDIDGRDLTSPQDTPVAAHKSESYVMFAKDVHVQKAIQTLPSGFAIVFEFKHYKPKKKIVSTRCWAFMEKDEMKEGAMALELYKKPTDARRKKISLFTVKPLYLHLKLLMN